MYVYIYIYIYIYIHIYISYLQRTEKNTLLFRKV